MYNYKFELKTSEYVNVEAVRMTVTPGICSLQKSIVN